MESLQSKVIGETITVFFYFAALILPEETLSSPVISVVVLSGIDPTPSNIILGNATLSGTTVTQQITEGLGGVVYGLICQVDGEEDRSYILERPLAILTDYGSFLPGHSLGLSGTISLTACINEFEYFPLTITEGYAPYGPVTISAGSLPSGWDVDITGSSVIVSGNSQTPGDYSFTIKLVDFVGNVAYSTQSVTLIDCSVVPPPPLPFALLINDNHGYGDAYAALVDTGAGGIPFTQTEYQPNGCIGGYVITNDGLTVDGFKICYPDPVTGVFVNCTIVGGVFGQGGCVSADSNWAVTCHAVHATSFQYYVYQRTDATTWTLFSGPVTQALGGLTVNGLKFSPDGTHVTASLTSSDTAQHLYIHNFSAGTLTVTSTGFVYGTAPYAMWSPDGSKLAVVSSNTAPADGTVYIYDYPSLVLADSSTAGIGNRSGLCWNRDGTYLYVSGDSFSNYGFIAYKIGSSGNIISRTNYDALQAVSNIDIAPNGDYLAVAFYDGPGYTQVFSIDNTTGDLTVSQNLTGGNRWNYWMIY